MTESAIPGPALAPSDLESAVLTPAESRRSAVAGVVGTFIEWYDIGLYGVSSALVIGPLFFSGLNGVAATLAAYGTFAAGFIVRPVGGAVLGPLGDRFGRKPVLLFCLALVGIVTGLIGCLPTSVQIGAAAPIILVLLRLLQGFGSGAELAGAITYTNENAVRGRKGFYSSFIVLTISLAGLGSLGIFTLVSTTVPPEQFLSWGWRIPFLLSFVLTAIAFVLRARAHESQEFERSKLVSRERESFFTAFRLSPRNFISVFLYPSGIQVTNWLMSTFVLSYIVGNLGLSREIALLVSLPPIAVSLVTVPFAGRLVDRFGSRKVLIAGAIWTAALAFPYFLTLQSKVPWLMVIGGIIIYFGWAMIWAAQVTFLPSLFPTRRRYTGIAIPRELNGALIAGPVPLLASLLVLALNGQPWLVAAMIVVGQAISVVGGLLGRPVKDEREPDPLEVLAVES